MALRFRICVLSASGSRIERDALIEPISDEVRIGRRAGVELELPFPAVSGLHARVFKQSAASSAPWMLADLGSANGTWLGAARLQAHSPRELKAGDVLKMANVEVIFLAPDGTAGASAHHAAAPESTGTIARRLARDLMGGAVSLLVDGGPQAGQALALAVPDRVYTVGRVAGCDLVLDDDDVSREHAGFIQRWQGIFVRDLRSKNGVEVDGMRISGEQLIFDGNRILLGSTWLRVEDPGARHLSAMRQAPDPESAVALVDVAAVSSASTPAQSPPAVQVPGAAPAGPPANKQPRPTFGTFAVTAVAALALGGVLGLALWLFLGH